MCLTGVDYFSTLGYQPSIAFDAMGMLAPLATIVLVGVTLGCALPDLLLRGATSRRMGKARSRCSSGCCAVGRPSFSCLVLLGFAATDFIITQTLSAADAAEHLIHNPYWQHAPSWLQNQMVVTIFLLIVLGSMFMRGFKEVILIAVAMVTIYLALNVLVIGSGVWLSADASGEVAVLVLRRVERRLAHRTFAGQRTWRSRRSLPFACCSFRSSRWG